VVGESVASTSSKYSRDPSCGNPVVVDGVPSSGSNSPPLPDAMVRAISKRRAS
jgi:hypothetical protein